MSTPSERSRQLLAQIKRHAHYICCKLQRLPTPELITLARECDEYSPVATMQTLYDALATLESAIERRLGEDA